MISIISGKYKSIKLYDSKDLSVRPTQAKVRKSVFQILEPLTGLSVLDLYAGIGTLGLEAISRGASKATFVEQNHRVFKVLQKNIRLLSDEKCASYLMDAIFFLSRSKNKYFDLIFADPPYAQISYEIIQSKILNTLKPGGIFCMEMHKENIDEPVERIKYYGNTQVVFWRAEA